MSTQSKSYSPRNRPKVWLYVNATLALLLMLAGIVALIWMKEQASPSNYSNPIKQIAARHQGKPAPDFNLPALSGEQAALSDYEGQVVLVNFWATWCPPCKAEMPMLNAFYEARKAQGFVVLAINNQEDAATVNEFIENKGFTFPILLDTKAQVIELYQVQGLPTTFIIDRSGQIRHVQIGEITEQQLETIVGPLLQ